MRTLLAAVLAAAAGAAAAQTMDAPMQPSENRNFKSDWELRQEERDWRADKAPLPPLPKAGDLVEVNLGSATSFRFFVDASSISVGRDGVVRYVFVARSPSGYDNVSFEGIRCRSENYRIFALLDGKHWTPTNDDWKPTAENGVRRWQGILERDYFCPRHMIIGSAEEGRDALRRGGNPRAELGATR
ncbi:MAG TPA: CNP1-like family protein [Burkholderiales bacterium]|nr:CNP1-like family protein [Burkholderiales bacterium]